MPPQKERRARLENQLPKAPLLQEHDRAVKDEHDSEQIDGGFSEEGVAVVQRMKARQPDERGGERRPAAAGDSRDREIGEQRRAAKHEQNQNPRGEYLRRKVVPERRDCQFQQNGAAKGKSAVQVPMNPAVLFRIGANELAEVERRRQIFRYRQRPRYGLAVKPLAVEDVPVFAEYEQRRQRDEQKRQRQAVAPFGEARAAEGERRQRGHGGAHRGGLRRGLRRALRQLHRRLEQLVLAHVLQRHRVAYLVSPQQR